MDCIAQQRRASRRLSLPPHKIKPGAVNAGPESAFAMTEQVPPPTGVFNLPATARAAILDAMLFEFFPSRRFLARPVSDGEFAHLATTPNVVIVDSARRLKRNPLNVAEPQACAGMSDAQLLALLRKHGVAV